MSSGYYLTSSFYYFNLGCHMMYILRNRLQAQNVRKQKMIRILEDISNAIFKEHFIQNLVIPQDPFNVSSLKDVYSLLAHSSIMKLDQTSMDKMFYLMLMSIKKQIFLTSSPLELYTLTLSHLLNISKFLAGSQAIDKILFAIQKFQQTASRYSFIQYLEIRSFMLSQLERYQTKIVNFIQIGFQNSNGKMIFRLRNSHNQKSIGSAMNQPDLDFPTSVLKPERQLFYADWISWKTSLVIDFIEDYKKSSQKRNNKGGSLRESSSKQVQQNQKSLGDILNIRFDDLENFEVKFDLLQNEGSTELNEDFEYEGTQRNKKKPESTIPVTKTANSFKNQIQKQFSDLKLDKTDEEQEPDLLGMMDN